jgi:TolB-like protein/Flp pilus assembly protein TadD
MGDLAAASEDAIRKELQRVVSSPLFDVSPRNRKFLDYVVNETLAGRSARIKAYSIATCVFGRGDDFDPLQDSIVRIEAARLRRALEYFYLKDGEGEAVRIVIPKGTYVPQFNNARGTDEPNPLAAKKVASRPLHDFGPRVLVQSFDQEGGEDYPTIGRKFTRQVISALTKYTEIFVYGTDTAEQLGSPGGKDIMRNELAVDYKTSGTVSISQKRLHVELLLNRAEDARFVWAFEEERALDSPPNPSEIDNLCAEIAGHIARNIAQSDGIMDSQARESAGDAPSCFVGYLKLLAFQDYWRSLDPNLFEQVRRDLEKTIVADPRFAAAYACLSMLYSNAARYYIDVSAVCASPLDRAMELARKAICLAPASSRAYHAKSIVEWFSGKSIESIATLRYARSLNPNESELLAELGFRYAMRMEWEAAVSLIEEAYARNPLQPGIYRMGLFFYHLAAGRFDDALREANAIDVRGIAYVHVAAAAALSRLGRIDEARFRLREAERLAPGLRRELAGQLTFHQIHPDLIGPIIEAIGRIDRNSHQPLRAAKVGSR